MHPVRANAPLLASPRRIDPSWSVAIEIEEEIDTEIEIKIEKEIEIEIEKEKAIEMAIKIIVPVVFYEPVTRSVSARTVRVRIKDGDITLRPCRTTDSFQCTNHCNQCNSDTNHCTIQPSRRGRRCSRDIISSIYPSQVSTDIHTNIHINTLIGRVYRY